MRCLYRERRYECGNYLEVYIFPVFKKQNGRGRRGKPTSAAQAKLNEINAERLLIRLLNANFTDEDYEIHLTYADGNLPEDDDRARRDVQNFLRRVKYARKKQNLPELKYVSVTEGGIGDTRYHHHITLSGGLTREELESLWPYGYANSRKLKFNERGIEGLALYITKQFRSKKNEMLFRKRWNCSKNLVRPEPIDRDGKISHQKAEELTNVGADGAREYERMYPGYTFTDVKPFYNDVNGGYYLAVKMRRRR